MENLVNTITSNLGTLEEIEARVKAAKSDLHLAKVSIFTDVFSGNIQLVKNDKYFPFFEITPYFGDDYDLVGVDAYIFFDWKEDIPTEDRKVQKFSSSVVSGILESYNKMNLDESLLEFINDLEISSTLKSKSPFTLNLSYDKDDIKEKLYKTLLTSEQLTQCRKIILEDHLPLKSITQTKLNKV